MVKPEKVFRVGAVRASLFRNTIEKNGQTIPLPKVVLEARYKDKQGNWQGTNSLSLNEIPKARSALRQAYDYLLQPKEKPKTGQDFQKAGSTDTSGFQSPQDKSNTPPTTSDDPYRR